MPTQGVVPEERGKQAGRTGSAGASGDGVGLPTPRAANRAASLLQRHLLRKTHCGPLLTGEAPVGWPSGGRTRPKSPGNATRGGLPQWWE